MKTKDKLPAKNLSDVAHTVVKSGIAGIPFVGAAAAELFNAIVAPPLSVRRDRWLTDLADGLKSLEERVDHLQIENLGSREIFITTVVHASEVAIKNHSVEKLEALKNAVLNAALDTSPADDVISIYLRFVDTFSAPHLRLLDLVDNPKKWFEIVAEKYPDKIHQEGVTNMYAYPTDLVFKGYEDKKELYKGLVSDLIARGLIKENRSSFLSGMIKDGESYIRYGTNQSSGATRLGQDFMKFINEPGVLSC